MHRFRSVVFLWVLPEKTTQWNSVYLQIGFLHVNRFKPCKMLRFPRWGDPGGTGFAEHRGVRRFLLWSTGRKIKQIINLYIDDLWSIYNASTTNTLFTYFLFFSYACPGGSGLPLLYLDGGASLGAILCITRVFNLSSRHWNQRNCLNFVNLHKTYIIAIAIISKDGRYGFLHKETQPYPRLCVMPT